jgi:alpha-tubulin suppressor-like RCC1 family protein
MARRGRLIPRSVPTLAVILLAVMGCDDAEPPTAPDPTPALATSATIPLVFHQVSATGFHTCGVTTDHRAYCWGHNAGGALGDGTTALRYTPVAVLGGLQFRQISTNGAHTCAITLDNLAYCWGVNDEGQLGDGTLIGRTAPVPVAGGLRFLQVGAGSSHTCGLTSPDRRAYCWGLGGALGDGTTTRRRTPVPVAGGRQFRVVAAGQAHTCGVTLSDKA